jgi:hypothetical protein
LLSAAPKQWPSRQAFLKISTTATTGGPFQPVHNKQITTTRPTIAKTAAGSFLLHQQT